MVHSSTVHYFLYISSLMILFHGKFDHEVYAEFP